MNGRSIIFTFEGVTLSVSDYSVSAKDKLVQIATIKSIIKTINIGRQASQIKITGKLPAGESSRLIEKLDPLVGAEGKSLTLDGARYTGVTLDAMTVTPSQSEGFAQFSLEFHF